MARKAKKQEFETIEKKDVRAGMQVRVHQLIKDVNAKGEEKERIQIFEGLVLARKHGNEPGATFTVRKVSDGVGVERTFPIHSPLVTTIDLVDTKITKRSKFYFSRDHKKRLKSTSEIRRTLEKGEKPGPQKNIGKKRKEAQQAQ
jgi:large subunit ribosomal protein L19